MKNKPKQTTGRKPGAPLGNSNAVKHGVYTKSAKQERQKIKQSIQQYNELLEEITTIGANND